MKASTRIPTLLTLLSLLLLWACGTQSDLPPATVEPATGFVFQVDPAQESVTLLETPTLESPYASGYLPSDTRLLVPDEDIALRNLSYRFRRGHRFVMRLKVKNITETLEFEPPFFFTLNADTARIKSATAPLVTDRDLGGDGVLSPGERTRRLTFEVKHKGRPFTFLIDTSAVVTEEPTEALGKIGFTRDGEIYVMNADGSNPTRLTDHPRHDFGHDWSPDGSKIAFTRGSEIYVMNADGSNPTNLTNHPANDYDPAWQPLPR